jgi:hypothetical protein
MKYENYLRTKHWIKFRKSILLKRSVCQICGASKKKGVVFNVHPINYKCLFKEKSEDVLFLCQSCHNSKHKQKIWINKYNKRKNLDFAKKANEKDYIYNLSDVLRDCNRCGEKHSVFYKRFKNGHLHLYIACPKSKPRQKSIKFEPDLKIPILGES